MTAARRRNFVLGFLMVLGLLAALLFLARPATGGSASADRSAQPSGRVDEPGPLPTPVAAPGIRPFEPPAPAARPPPPPIQVPLERPPPGRFDAGPRAIAEPRAPSGPADKRENPGPNAARQREIIRYAFETLEEDVRACLEQWESSAPGEAAEVMIAFEIDAAGLQKSWLEHDREVPFGPRTCLANAVYGLDWSKIVDHPAKLTQRFELGRRDAD